MTVSALAVGMALIVLAAMIVLVLAAVGLRRPRYRRTVQRRVAQLHGPLHQTQH